MKNRKNIRLKDYDYSQTGYYFVTICTKDRMNYFGKIIDGVMILNEAGKMVEKWLFEIENKYPQYHCDYYQIMPNHIHFIIQNVGADLCVWPNNNVENVIEKGEHAGSPLPTVVQWFKTMTTNEYIRGVKNNNWMNFNKKLWQRNYYEHIIRNEKVLYEIRNYIYLNPINWDFDENN